VDIAVVDLPHISNFTDFDALRIEPDVSVRIVRAAAELGEPDAVILPGSKNVLADLAHLRATGIASAIAALQRAEIIGVCGGYQMLGRRIEDPHGIESRDGAATGLGLLSLTTVMAPEKTLVRTTARHLGAGLKLCGYEIHHGRSATEQLAPLVQRDDGETIGVGTSDGRIWGSYLHGIFDADEFRRWFVDRLRQRRGLAPLRRVMAVYDLEPAFERLAATVRESVDINAIYRQMGLR
jgi:cobyric acid synthase